MRVFEDRYVQLLKDVEDDGRFVIAMISSGEEVGAMATPYRVGTLVEFDAIDRQGDFQYIRPKGRRRVYLESFDRESKPYLMANVRDYADDPAEPQAVDRLPELEAKILKMVTVLGPEESRGIRDVLDGVSATRLDPPELAELKGSARMRRLLKAALALDPPGVPTELRLVYRGEVLRLSASELTAVRRAVHKGRVTPNRARREAAAALLEALWRSASDLPFRREPMVADDPVTYLGRSKSGAGHQP